MWRKARTVKTIFTSCLYKAIVCRGLMRPGPELFLRVIYKYFTRSALKQNRRTSRSRPEKIITGHSKFSDPTSNSRPCTKELPGPQKPTLKRTKASDNETGHNSFDLMRSALKLALLFLSLLVVIA